MSVKDALESRYVYKYGLIDAQYILMRNKNMLSSQYYPDPIPKDKLLVITIQSFMKLKRDNRFKYPLLLWDKSPYHKSRVVSEYKGDRYIESEDDITRLQDELVKVSDPKEQEKIKEKIRKIEVGMANFSTLQDIKYGLLNDEWSSYGFTSVLKGGYEADDLAYMIAKRISADYKIGDKNSTAVLLTADKDWINFQLPGVTFISTYNGSNYPELYDEYINLAKKVDSYSRENYGVPILLSRYQYGILQELLGASHNNAGIWTHSFKEIPEVEVISRLLCKDTTLPDYELLSKCYESMNMELGTTDSGTQYIDDTTNLINYKLSDASFNVTNSNLFVKYCKDNNLLINSMNYALFIDGYSGGTT